MDTAEADGGEGIKTEEIRGVRTSDFYFSADNRQQYQSQALAAIIAELSDFRIYGFFRYKVIVQNN